MEPARVSRLWSIALPRGAVYALGGLLIAVAVALPWLLRWQGFLRFEPLPPASREPRPEMIELPGGTFWMGSPEGEAGHLDNEARHEVTVSGFRLCRTEVTQGQWKAVMGGNPSDCTWGCGDTLPVHDVSWYDAIEYLNRLSDREGLTRCYQGSGGQIRWQRGCTGYRLPTEAEWEYATRAGTRTAYSFGDDPADLGKYAWFGPNAGEQVMPVGSRHPNPWGFYDLHGNAWEWVWDWYEPYSATPAVDPIGPDTGDTRVLRGGAFLGGPGVLRSTVRYGVGPTVSSGSLGFRCARGGSPALSPGPLDP